jgi:hypothetical protein
MIFEAIGKNKEHPPGMIADGGALQAFSNPSPQHGAQRAISLSDGLDN